MLRVLEVHAHDESDGGVEVGHGDGFVGDALGDLVGLAVRRSPRFMPAPASHQVKTPG